MDNIVHESEHLERVVAPPPSSWRRLSDEGSRVVLGKSDAAARYSFLFCSLGFTGPGSYCKALN